MRNSPEFHNLLGFTKNEIELYFKESIKNVCLLKGISEDQLFKEIKEHYEGYKYHVQSNDTLYNAFAIQNYFKNQGIVRDYFSDSGGTSILFQTLAKQAIPDLRNYLMMMRDRDFRLKLKENNLNSPKEWKALMTDFTQMCFDTGYLTIDKNCHNSKLQAEELNLKNQSKSSDNEFYLKVPNQETFKSFQKVLKDILAGVDQLGSIVESLKMNNFREFLMNIETVAFKDKESPQYKETCKL